MKSSKIIRYLFGILGIALILLSVSHSLGLDSVFSFVGGAGTLAYVAVPFTSLEHNEDEDNLPGFKSIAYVVKCSDLSAYPSPTASPANVGDLVTLVGDFTLKENKYFTKFYSTMDVTELSSKMQGPRDSESFLIEGKLFYPGSTKNAIGMTANFKGKDCVVILQEIGGDNSFFAFGEEGNGARLSGSFAAGKSLSTDAKGTTFDLKYTSARPLWFYEGLIPLSPSEIIS